MLKIGVVSPNNQLIESLLKHNVIADRHNIEFFFLGDEKAIPFGIPTNHCENFEALLSHSEIILFGNIAEVEQVFLSIKSFKQVLITDLSIFDKGSIQKLLDISNEAGVFIHYLSTGWSQIYFSQLSAQKEVIKYMDWSNFKERELILDNHDLMSWIIDDLILITSALRKKLKEITLEIFNLHSREIDLVRLKLVFTNNLILYGKWSNIAELNVNGLRVSIDGHCLMPNVEPAHSELNPILYADDTLELNRKPPFLNKEGLLSFLKGLNGDNLQTINLEDCLQALAVQEKLKMKILNFNYVTSD